MSMGLNARLGAMPRIHLAAADVPGLPNATDARGSADDEARYSDGRDPLGIGPLTIQAEILGSALQSLGTGNAGASPHWRFGNPRALDPISPSAVQPLGRAGSDDLSSTLSPMIARSLYASGDAPVQPLGQSVSTTPWNGSVTEFVFARVRRRHVKDAPLAAEPAQLPGGTRTPVESLSSGELLPGAARQAMEPIIGTNLGEVRIHTSPAAGAMASALAADAFTVGREVFFAEGKFDPFSPRGQALLAHELVHVRQQERSTERVQRHGDHPDSAEAEAEVVERAVLVHAEGGASQIEVGSFVRRYHTTDGGRMSAGQRERLDEMSVQALAVAEQILGPTLSQHAGKSLDSLTVDVELDLSLLDTSSAARHWGQALASAISRALG